MSFDKSAENRSTEIVPTLSAAAAAGGKQRGGIGYVLLWLLGVPIPVLILIALLRGCS